MTRRWLTAWLGDWAAILAAYALLLMPTTRWSPLLWVDSWIVITAVYLLAVLLAILVIGNRQHAIAILAHDGAHRLISRNRFINETLTALSLWPMGVSVPAYRRFHFAHHRHVGSPVDPERAEAHRYPLPRRPWVDALRSFVGLNWRDAAGIFKLTRPTVIEAIPVLIFVGCCGSVLALAGHLEFGLLWLLAMPTAFIACFRARVYTEHIGTTYRYITPTRLQRILYLPHNCWLHPEHHQAPGVPFWRLQRGI